MTTQETIPTAGGTYALLMELAHPQTLLIGRLGRLSFPSGDYIYIGSALGTGGLRARLRGYLTTERRPHWHIDYLLKEATLRGVLYLAAEQRLECAWCRALAALPGAQFPASGFGSSDCRAQPYRCSAHLIAFPGRVATEALRLSLAQACSRDIQGINHLAVL